MGRFKERREEEDDDDTPRKRSKSRGDDEEEEDDTPRKRRKSRDDDEEDEDEDDEQPRKSKKSSKKGKKSGSNLPLILGGGGLLLLVLLTCCGVGGYFAFFKGGASPLGGVGDEFEISSASVQDRRNLGGGYYVDVNYTMKTAVSEKDSYVIVVKANGKRYEIPMVFLFASAGMTGNQGETVRAMNNANGPYEIWIEKKSGLGKVVSNTITVK